MATEVIMPKVDMVMDEGTFVEWLKQEGERPLADILESHPVPRFRIPMNERQAKALAYVGEHGMLNLSIYRQLCPYWSDETLRLDLARNEVVKENGSAAPLRVGLSPSNSVSILAERNPSRVISPTLL